MKLKSKSYAEVMAVTDMSEEFPGTAAMLKAIKAVYPVMKDQIVIGKASCNKLLKGNVISFFEEMMDNIDLIGDDRCKIKVEFEEGHYFVRKAMFHDFDENCFYGVPISFLPELAKINKDMHDLFCMCIQILAEKNVPVIDSWPYDFSWELERIEEDLRETPKDESASLREEVKLYYKHGQKYHKILTNTTTIDAIKHQLDHSEIQQTLKDQFVKILPILKKVSESNMDLIAINDAAKERHAILLDIDIDDLYNDGSPVEIPQIFRIVWFSDASYLENICQELGELSGNFGELLPVVYHDCFTPEDYLSVENDYEKTYGTFAEDLAEAMTMLKDLSDDIIEYINSNPCPKKKKNSSHQALSLFTEEVNTPVTM